MYFFFAKKHGKILTDWSFQIKKLHHPIWWNTPDSPILSTILLMGKVVKMWEPEKGAPRFKPLQPPKPPSKIWDHSLPLSIELPCRVVWSNRWEATLQASWTPWQKEVRLNIIKSKDKIKVFCKISLIDGRLYGCIYSGFSEKVIPPAPFVFHFLSILF